MFSKHKLKTELGFTLIELLVAIAIIGVLASAMVMIVNPATQIAKAKDAQRKSDLAQIQHALDIYYQDKGKYPANPGVGTYTIGSNNWDTDWSPYMSRIPKDPVSSSRTYIYFSPTSGGQCSSNQCYYIYASLQINSDSQVCNSGGPGVCSSLAANGIASNACGQTCNYGVSSTNVTP